MEIQNRAKKNPKVLRLTFYLLALALLITAVLWKRSAVLSARTGEIISVFTEQGKYGIPVNVEKIALGEFPVWMRVTAKESTSGNLETYVDRAAKNRLIRGQNFRSVNHDPSFEGRISYVADEQDITNYLYVARFETSKPTTFKTGTFYTLEVQTDAYKNVVKIPQQAIFRIGDESYAWTVKDNTARKTRVKEGFTDGIYTLIKEGLKAGDLVVTAGTGIQDGSKLRIHKCENC